jgi:hypothetical protein
MYSSKTVIKSINILFSQINNVNSTISNLQKLYVLRKYLIKSYQGYCHFLGKPVRGQRTWSNAWNSFKCNNLLRSFITKVRNINTTHFNNPTKNFKKIQKKYTPSKLSKNQNSVLDIKSTNKDINKWTSKMWF